MPTIDDLLAEGRSIIRGNGAEVDPREAAYLLAQSLGVDEVRVRAFGEWTVSSECAARFRDLVRRRAAGEPAAYLTGRREFYGREFLVDPRVLVPRPETEHLIEAVLTLDLPGSSRILDIGTGSGCIAVTLALELETRVVAGDLSLGALDVARANARRLGAGVAFVRADLDTALGLDGFDVVVSNPPYVSREVVANLSREVVDHEPHLALFAPDGGTRILERLLEATARMRAGAVMVLEIGHDQGVWMEERAAALDHHLTLERLIRDYGDRPRTAVLRVS